MSYKFNVAQEDCKYIIDRDKRKVVCLIENTKFMFTDFMNHNFVIAVDPFFTYSQSYKSLYPQLLMPNRFWGIATCDESDEWDEEVGKLIAYSRAKDKLNKSFFKRANCYVDTMDKYLNDSVDILNRLGDKLTASTERRHKKIADIIGEPEVDN